MTQKRSKKKKYTTFFFKLKLGWKPFQISFTDQLFVTLTDTDPVTLPFPKFLVCDCTSAYQVYHQPLILLVLPMTSSVDNIIWFPINPYLKKKKKKGPWLMIVSQWWDRGKTKEHLNLIIIWPGGDNLSALDLNLTPPCWIMMKWHASMHESVRDTLAPDLAWRLLVVSCPVWISVQSHRNLEFIHSVLSEPPFLNGRFGQGLRASSLQFTSPLEFNAIFRDGFPLRLDLNGWSKIRDPAAKFKHARLL